MLSSLMYDGLLFYNFLLFTFLSLFRVHVLTVFQGCIFYYPSIQCFSLQLSLEFSKNNFLNALHFGSAAVTVLFCDMFSMV